MSDRPLCIYHGNCADGFASAWVVWKYFKGAVDLHAGTYGQAPPVVTGRKVYLVDFSYKRAVMKQLLQEAAAVTILDHHKSAMADLEALDIGHNGGTYIAFFDLGYSGCMLAWYHFFPGDPPPQLLRHIQDRDLWQFKLEGTEEIQNALFSYPYDMETWDALLSKDAVGQLQADGIAITRKHHKDVAELVAATRRSMIIGGHLVPTANLPYTLSSDAGHLMAPGYPFAACYWDTPNGRVFSLRSSKTGADVAEIAQRYGGGGHQHASGFTMPIGWEGDLR